MRPALPALAVNGGRGRSFRNQLLRAARRRFAAYGYVGVSVRAIVADARASPQMVINYFGSKPGLLEVANMEPFANFIAEFSGRRPALPKDENVFDRTHALVEVMFSATPW